MPCRWPGLTGRNSGWSRCFCELMAREQVLWAPYRVVRSVPKPVKPQKFTSAVHITQNPCKRDRGWRFLNLSSMPINTVLRRAWLAAASRLPTISAAPCTHLATPNHIRQQVGLPPPIHSPGFRCGGRSVGGMQPGCPPCRPPRPTARQMTLSRHPLTFKEWPICTWSVSG